MEQKGDRYGTHRVMDDGVILPQVAYRLDNDFTKAYDNEILCDVIFLNIDAASFEDIKSRSDHDPDKMAACMKEIVRQRGKHHNPVTGSGGMFIGTAIRIGQKLKNKIDLQPGEVVVSLVSLTLTPLYIDDILTVYPDKGRVDIKGRAVLFESAVWTKPPPDLPLSLCLAVSDVAGAPARTRRLVRPGHTAAVIGAGGKSGLLCCYAAKKQAGSTGTVIAVDYREEEKKHLLDAPFVDQVVIGSGRDALQLLEKIENITNGALCDVVIVCVSQTDCELGSILITKEQGTVCFFSMATDFTKAALGAEGVGKDIHMVIGSGYCLGHAESAPAILRESAYLKNLFMKRYG